MKRFPEEALFKWQDVIRQSAMQSNALCLALFDIKEHDLLFANNAFLSLSKGNPMHSLINPGYQKLLASITPNNQNNQLIFEGLLTIGDDSSLNTTIQSRVYATQNELLVTGEIDLLKMNQQHQIMAGLNREVNNLQRQLTKEKFQLENALKALEKANSELTMLNAEKNRFLNMAAHDLRNPISTAISFADILIRDAQNFSEEQKKSFLTKMEERLQFAIQLMTELLDVSKIEAGTVELNLQEQDFNALMSQVVDFNQLVANYKDIQIALDAPQGSLVFHFDRNKMEQVLNNLISNAIKYSPHQTLIRIHVRADDSNCHIQVEDQGPGIQADDLPLVFEPFQKTRNKPTAGESSTGLGLAISRKIVDQHGGKIQLESKPGKGSIFTVSIPLQNHHKSRP